jgi:hypothetical protein
LGGVVVGGVWGVFFFVVLFSGVSSVVVWLGVGVFRWVLLCWVLVLVVCGLGRVKVVTFYFYGDVLSGWDVVAE